MLKSIKLGAHCFAVLLFFACSLAARAQDTGMQQPNPQAKTQSGMHHGPGRLEWLSKELDLTDDQKGKLKPILDDEGKQMQAVREDASLSQDQKHDKMKQIHGTTNSQINDILTPDQQKKFAQLKEQRKEHPEGNKGAPPQEPKQP
jgi:periplasmic protein CpxP/Spy